MRKAYILIVAIMLICNGLFAQRIALKTNALYWLTTTPNLGLEFSLTRKWTVDISANYNPFTFAGSDKLNPKLLHWLVQPEVRYWWCRSFERHFLGLHALYGEYNLGGIKFIPPLKDYRYDGKMLGGGLSYGYHWAVGLRWGIEASIGVGYMRLEYDKYVCGTCGEIDGRYVRNYIGPTKAVFSVIYFLK